MPGVGEREAPLLGDLMPWSVGPLRLGRAWVMGPDAASLAARWERLVGAEDEAGRAALFRPSRARTLHTSVPQLPGQATSTARLARAGGPCPAPVRVTHGPFDQQWLIPDHRLIDTARPELWRVADDRQIHVVEAAGPDPDPVLTFSALLPDGHSPAGRPGRIRPLYRRPGGQEPNLAPGLLDHLSTRLARPVTAGDFLAWTAAVAGTHPCAVPLTTDTEAWETGVALGRRVLWLHTRGAHRGERPRMPGGRRPYVRASLPARGLPDSPLRYDPDESALLLGEGRISPVPRAAWEFHAGGARVLETWFEGRTARGEPGTLEAIGPAGWPSAWTSELLELITVLALLAELRPERRALTDRLADGPGIDVAELRAVGVLPVPGAARRPASVLDHHEEGPEGQFALL
ncbi:type ISP restriction/modification enzyme [Streptomyces sp. NPDC005271]|uniref:type ISP restriction/modification enzyme n=1 Tax=unclassified Streptomyces TaxID=2593676 RepID=UPI0033A3FDB4